MNESIWIVWFSRKRTADDIGTYGRKIVKSALFECDRSDLDAEIEKHSEYAGWHIESVDDWVLLGEQQLSENIRWIFSK